MTATFAKHYCTLNNQWEYYVEADNNWVWFGMGQIISSDKDVYISPYIPISYSGKRKEVSGDVADKIGRKIGRMIKKHYNKHHVKQIP